jgi:hypothetical protein
LLVKPALSSEGERPVVMRLQRSAAPADARGAEILVEAQPPARSVIDQHLAVDDLRTRTAEIDTETWQAQSLGLDRLPGRREVKHRRHCRAHILGAADRDTDSAGSAVITVLRRRCDPTEASQLDVEDVDGFRFDRPGKFVPGADALIEYYRQRSASAEFGKFVETTFERFLPVRHPEIGQALCDRLRLRKRITPVDVDADCHLRCALPQNSNTSYVSVAVTRKFDLESTGPIGLDLPNLFDHSRLAGDEYLLCDLNRVGPGTKQVSDASAGPSAFEVPQSPVERAQDVARSYELSGDGLPRIASVPVKGRDENLPRSRQESWKLVGVAGVERRGAPSFLIRVANSN